MQHIYLNQGLLVNFLHRYWPELLKHDKGFLQQFATPVLKATPVATGKGRQRGNALPFYSLGAFERWKSKEEKKSAVKPFNDRWRVKYYKGLGTSTAAEARAYFQNLESHRATFVWPCEGGNNDGGAGRVDAVDDLIDMVFRKDRAGDRRSWLSEQVSPEPLVAGEATVPYEDFINRELVNFSHADNVRCVPLFAAASLPSPDRQAPLALPTARGRDRSIPSVVDGLKPSQRKLLFACFKRKLTEEVKVAQLAGYCAEHTAYHHGEASMQATIVNMAQSFVGSNNVPLLNA